MRGSGPVRVPFCPRSPVISAALEGQDHSHGGCACLSPPDGVHLLLLALVIMSFCCMLYVFKGYVVNTEQLCGILTWENAKVHVGKCQWQE